MEHLREAAAQFERWRNYTRFQVVLNSALFWANVGVAGWQIVAVEWSALICIAASVWMWRELRKALDDFERASLALYEVFQCLQQTDKK